MSGNQENVLESIIKVEPQEFEAVSVDDLLRLKANIFSDPIVFVERLSSKRTTSLLPIAAKSKNENIFSETVLICAKKRIEKTSSKDPHACSICQRVLVNRQSLKRHFDTVHNHSMKMFCDLCPKLYFSKDSMRNHIRIVHSKKCFACNVCDYKTAHKTSLQNHKMIHAAKVECPICLKQVSVLKKHMKYHRPKAPCSICQKMVHKHNLWRHMKISHRKIKCTDCGDVLENQEDLRRHKLKRHYKGQIFECHCGSVFNAKDRFKRHQQAVHSSEKPICKVCKKEFSSGGSLHFHWQIKHLETHERLHADKRIRDLKRGGPFICDKCGTKHRSRSAFQAHNYQHHRNTALFCDLCPRSFTLKTLLVMHIERVHLKLRPFHCKDCEYKSFYKISLESHMKQHGSKTECKVCHKFVANMYSHLQSHVKTKCPICNKIVTRVYLRKHIRNHKK